MGRLNGGRVLTMDTARRDFALHQRPRIGQLGYRRGGNGDRGGLWRHMQISEEMEIDPLRRSSALRFQTRRRMPSTVVSMD